MKAAPKWEAHAMTHQGLVRRENEDSGFCDPQRGILVVADGMGGHAGGALASRTTVHAIVEFIQSCGFGNSEGFPDDASTWEMRQVAKAALSAANGAVLAARIQPGGGDEMGSTAVVLLLNGTQVHGASIGDSRAYLIGGGEIQRLTRDQTLAQEAEDSGITTDRAEGGNVLLACIGDTKLGEPVYFTANLAEGQRILLCTDGLTDMIPETEIATVVDGAANPIDACSALVDAALKAGGEDNVTTIVAQPTGAAKNGQKGLAGLFKSRGGGTR